MLKKYSKSPAFLMACIIGLLSYTSLSSQTLQIEDLAPTPHTEIRNVYISPQGSIYITTNSLNVIRSLDKGQTWNELMDLPQAVTEIEIRFSENGKALFKMFRPAVPPAFYPERYLYVFDQGKYRNILPTTITYINDSSYAINDKTIAWYWQDSIHLSKDFGVTYEVIADSQPSGQQRMSITKDRILVEKYIVDRDVSKELYIDIYDLDFKFLDRIDIFSLPYSVSPSTQRHIANDDGQMVYFNDSSTVMTYTDDYGINTYEKRLNDFTEGLNTIKDGYLYIIENDNYVRIKLDDNFENNDFEILGEYNRWHNEYPDSETFIRQHYEVINKFASELIIQNLSNNDKLFTESLDFPHSRTERIYTRKNNDILASTGSHIFKSEDDGASWQLYYDFDIQPSDISFNEGGITYFSDGLIYEYRDNGVESNWTIQTAPLPSNIKVNTYNIENGKYRFAQRNCDDTLYISKDFGPFEPHAINRSLCISSGGEPSFTEAKLIDDDLFVYNRTCRTSAGFLHMDLSNNLIYEQNQYERIDLNSPVTFGWYVTDSKEILIHPYLFIGSTSTGFQSSFHAPDPFSTFIQIGEGPTGEIYYNETYQFSLLNTGQNLFVRNKLENDFKQVDILNQDFSKIHSVSFDNQGRIIMGVDENRIVRSEISGLATSIKDIDAHHFRIYPNPVDDKLHVDLENYENTRYTIYDINGLIVKQGLGTQLIDVSTLSNGMHLITLSSERGIRVTQKFVKM